MERVQLLYRALSYPRPELCITMPKECIVRNLFFCSHVTSSFNSFPTRFYWEGVAVGAGPASAPAAGAATSSAPLNAGLNVPDFCATTFQSIKSHHASANAILPPLPPAPTPQSSNQACSHVFRHSNGSSSMPPGGRLPARTREPNSWLRKCERAEPSLPTVFMSVDCARQWAPG